MPRQRTLEATVEWSYQLLAEAERIMLTRLSVFPASCTLEAAERVCGGDPVRFLMRPWTCWEDSSESRS